MKLIDLSQTIAVAMPRFSEAAPQPIIRPWQSHADAADNGLYQDCTCEITEVQFLTSLGTYLDSPFHFHPAGRNIAELDLEQLVLPGVVIDCRDAGARAPLGPERLANLDLAGKAVLFHTGWSRFWGQPAYLEFPFLTGALAQALVAGGAKLAGVDFLVIDDTRDPRRPVHVTLLAHEVLIVENLTNLAALPAGDFVFHAVPVKVAAAAAFPVRAYAVV